MPFGIPVQFRDTVTSPDTAGATDVSQLATVDEAEAKLLEMEQTLGTLSSRFGGSDDAGGSSCIRGGGVCVSRRVV